MKIAKANQRPGQTKEQTKLVAQGIQKGIEQYKKQQKSKSRDLDKKIKTVKKTQAALEASSAENAESETEIIVRQHPLPWVLLAASWLVFCLAWFL